MKASQGVQKDANAGPGDHVKVPPKLTPAPPSEVPAEEKKQ